MDFILFCNMIIKKILRLVTLKHYENKREYLLLCFKMDNNNQNLIHSKQQNAIKKYSVSTYL